MRLLLLVFALLVLSSLANADKQIFSYEKNRIAVDVDISIKVIPTKTDYSVEYVKANVTFVPVNYSAQKLISAKTIPQAEFYNKAAQFYWENPSAGELDASADYVVEISQFQPQIKQKVDFPVREHDAALNKYIIPSPMIDSDDPDIIKVASALAEGEDDLFVVAYKAANWTQKNIEYNLSTLTADVSQTASWVLKNKQGVCDELTNLFIAIMRSLGVPARFVTGEAYTDSPLFPENWGLHGWAEVYFAGYGWVPFDVSYGEFGYIDATHIKAGDSIDSSEVVDFTTSGFGRNFEIKAEELTITPRVLESFGKIEPDVALSSRMISDEVSFGSYNLAELTIENVRDFYVISDITSSRTTGLSIDVPGRTILLHPGEVRKEYFLVKVGDELERNFIYTFPVGFQATKNASSLTSFKSTSTSEFYDSTFFSDYFTADEKKTVIPGLKIDCDSDKKAYYDYETARLNCTLSNLGNKALKDVKVCLGKCFITTLQISRSTSFLFMKNFTKPGDQSMLVRASNEDLEKTDIVKVSVMDTPSLSVQNITLPQFVSFDDTFNLSFVALKTSRSHAQDSVISIGTQTFNDGSLERDRLYTVTMRASSLEVGENNIPITISYSDSNGRNYLATGQATTNLKELTFWQSIKKFLDRILGN